MGSSNWSDVILWRSQIATRSSCSDSGGFLARGDEVVSSSSDNESGVMGRTKTDSLEALATVRDVELSGRGVYWDVKTTSRTSSNGKRSGGGRRT